MKKSLLLFLALAVGSLLYWLLLRPVEPGVVLEEGYRYLYDGQSLEGWHVVGGESTFEPAGDDIVGRHGPGANTFLRTDQTFADFSLKLQMRWQEPGNSGVMFRASQRSGAGRVYGYQYELDHSPRAFSGGIYDEARRGWLAPLENNQAARDAVRLDDWNDIEIEVRGARLKTWINGVPAADIVDVLDRQGFIALQVHSGDVGVMRWRNIRIKEYPAPALTVAPLQDLGGWGLENISALQVMGDELVGQLQAGNHWLTPRRQLDDAVVRMTVPACDAPTIVRMRYLSGDGGDDHYAEVKVYADRAQAMTVTARGESQWDSVALEKSPEHEFVGVTLGDAVTFTVDNVDVLRLMDTDLAARGQLRIQPARCADDFRISAFSWRNLRDKGDDVLFYQTLDNQPAPVLTPEAALNAFSVAPGFEVELVAAEPLVEDPVAMDWDEYGRLYVVEMRGYMPDAYGTGSEEPVGQVVRLEDTDGDGRMDTSAVFLDKLVNPRAVAVVNAGVLIGEPPNLWLCALPERDSLCTHQRRVGDYAVDPNADNVEHMENGLRAGLDNWLYNAKSARSLRLVKGELAVREGLFRGQWGITHDNYGRLFYNHNSTWLQADFFAARDLVSPGSNTYPPGLGVTLSELSEVFSVRVNPGVNRAYLDDTLRPDGRLHLATGVSGLVAYRGDQFPKEYRNDVFVPEVAGNVVARLTVAEEGLSLTAEHRLYDDERWGQREFLASTDERFRPVDAMNGPDGALYVIDMYRGIVQHDEFLTDELREQIFQRQLDIPIGMGRIWRIRHLDGQAGRRHPPLAGATDAALVTALGHANGWVRDTAQRLLLGREGELQQPLAALTTGEDSLAAIHALWTLQGRGELQRSHVLGVAALNDPRRQVHALRAGRALLQQQDMATLFNALSNAPDSVVMQLAFTLGDYSASADIRDLLQQILVARLDSPYVRQAVVRAVQGNELSFLRELLATSALSSESDAGRETLAVLSANAYRSLRGALDSDAPANPRLLGILSLAQARQGPLVWQQVAMLEGLQGVTVEDGFRPAALADVPPIFADGDISENDPLWAARLAGRSAFTWPGDELAMGLTPLSPEQLQLMVKGESFYRVCAACHGATGAGTPGLAPALAGASWVTGPPEWLARIILQGLTGPVTVNGTTWNGVMPPHKHLTNMDDETLAGLMTYLRRSWGNKADPVSAAQVAAMRDSSAARTRPWTVTELEAVPYDRGFKRFVGKYGVSFMTMTITEEAEGLHMSVPMYGSGVMTQLSDTVFSASAGGEAVDIEFIVLADGSVNEFILHRQGQKIPVQRKSP